MGAAGIKHSLRAVGCGVLLSGTVMAFLTECHRHPMAAEIFDPRVARWSRSCETVAKR